MARAIKLAARGLYTTDPNPRVGCVLVKNGAIVGEGWHRRAGEAHAEINALERAGEQARGATAYVSLEPCCHQGRTGPCTDALARAGIASVVIAMRDPNPAVSGQGITALQAADIAVEVGVMAGEAAALNPGFISRMRDHRPFLRCKLAMSLDGRTALASGESKWITGPPARADVHRLRARSSCILTGIDTVIADDPRMDARLEGVKQPSRVVLDSRLRMPTTARMFLAGGPVMIATTSSDESRYDPLVEAGAEIVVLPGNEHGIDLSALMQFLAHRECNEVLAECGPKLAGALLGAGLIDELVLYVAPALLGDSSRPLLCLDPFTNMAERRELAIRDIRAVGQDWRITATLKASSGQSPAS